MTINIGYFEELKKRIETAGSSELLALKKEITERLREVDFVSRNHEDPTGDWLLFLDALCNVRLGACCWDAGQKLLVCHSEEMDLLADWYEKLVDAVRSVNQRQKDGRGGCNEQKVDAVINLYDSNTALVERIVYSGNKYVTHLMERTRQLRFMRYSGKWSKIEKVEAMYSRYL